MSQVHDSMPRVSVGPLGRPQQLAPSGGPVELGTTFQDLGTFVVNGGSIVVTLNNNANGYVIADAVRIEKL